MLNKININPQKQKIIIYIALTIVTLAVYWQVNQFDFVNFDDTAYVTRNSHVQSGISLQGILWAFRTTHADFWHPLTWLSLMVDYELYGLNAGGYHATNLFLHLLSTLLLFWLFCRMTGEPWKSAFIAAFFALHPLHVESVVWIAERKDVLSAFFWMLTLCLYVYYVEKPVVRRYLLVLFSFICGLMSKPMVVTLPVMMILLDYWPLKRFESQKGNLFLWQLKEKMGFFVLSAVFSVITLYVQSYGNHSLNSRMANSVVAFVSYLKKIFWPCDLAVFYPFPDNFQAPQSMGDALLIIAISAIVITAAKRLPFLFVGWLWFSIALLPVIGIVRKGFFLVADHYIYLPSIGIAVMLGWGIPAFIKNKKTRRKILPPTAIFFLAIMAVLTWKQCGFWQNSFKLFNHAALSTQGNYLAYTNRGNAYIEIGYYQQAIEDCNEALRLKPDYAFAFFNRGFAYAKIGQYQQALKDLTEGIRLKPDYAGTFCNRGNVYNKLGQYQQAIKDYNEAICLLPDYAEAYYNRGNAYFKLKQYQQAIESYNEGIHLKPNNVEAYFNNRGNAYGKLGRYPQAIEDYSRVLSLNSSDTKALSNRALVYFKTGNTASGCSDAEKACELGNCAIMQTAKSNGLCR